MQIKKSHFLITGANRGIGLATAEMAATEGAHLHLVVRTKDSELERKLINLGASSVQSWETDLSIKEDVSVLIEQLREQRIDILFNNAGLLTGGLLEEQILNDIYSMFQVNICSLVHLTHALLPPMIKRGSGKIINNSSVSALMHFPCASTYAASKAAVWAFTDCLQAELRGTGVSALCLITPGIKTRMFDDISSKYGKNFNLPLDSISPEDYSLLIKEAILDDRPILLPHGKTRIGLGFAKFMPSIFNQLISAYFKR